MPRITTLAPILALLPALSLVVSCGDADQAPSAPASVAEVTIDPGTDTLTALDSSTRFTAVAKARDGTPIPGRSFVWTVSNAAVASVDSSGLATALGTGSATVSATTEGVTGTATLVVVQEATRVRIDPGADTLRSLDATTRFTATVTDANGNSVPDAGTSWSSSDPDVATVDDTGLVTTLGPGRTVITAAVDGAAASADLIVFPPVEGPRPSYRLGAFYYNWYGTPEIDGRWVHWENPDIGADPPADIPSDFYPLLGPYSSNDRVLLARHMAWLRRAGIGVIVATWWGQDLYEDRSVDALMDAAEDYEIKVAFHIEPESGRTVTDFVDDVRYIYDRYGDHPAFFRTAITTRWTTNDKPRGVFFVFATADRDLEYWRRALDAIHELPEGAVVIGQFRHGARLERGHFDGGYNYVTLAEGDDLDFSWAQTLPPGILYAPSVAPGFSARRIGYPQRDYLPRLGGRTYREQWEAAVRPGIEPFLTMVTSFNEWHEGTQIEPATEKAPEREPATYSDYDPLPTDGYLDLTRQLADELFLNRTWPDPSVVRVRLTTSSDWTWVELTHGARWARPEVLSVTETAEEFHIRDGRIHLTQPLTEAKAGRSVEGVVEMGVIGPCTADPLRVGIGRGSIGETTLELSEGRDQGAELIARFVWDGTVADDPENVQTFELPCGDLLSQVR